jgi:hypothetical protein
MMTLKGSSVLKILKLALAAGVLMTCAHARAASPPTPGWLVYQFPYFDMHYGSIPGLARRVAKAAPQKGSPTVIDLVDEGGYKVSVHFFTEKSASDLLAKVREGESLDLTGCMHEGRRANKGPIEHGCRESSYEAKFVCTIFDRTPLLESDSIDSHYREANAREQTVYLHHRECGASVM